MKQIVKVGIAGLGEAATEFLPSYAQHNLVRVTAAADTREEALVKFKAEFGGETYTRVEDLCASDEVDVVYIATPHELHKEHALIAARNRKHIIVEKPMALSMEDCNAINAAVREHNVKLICGHNHSYDAPVRKMREIITSGQLGKLRMINTWNFNDFMVRPYPDHALVMSRGVVLNQGPHQVDIVRLLGGGLVRSVRAIAGQWDLKRPGEGAYLCFLEFENGVGASLVFNGYGLFDTAELFWWMNEGGRRRYSDKHVLARRNYRLAKERQWESDPFEEQKNKMRYGSVGLGEVAQMSEGWEKGGVKAGEGGAIGQPFFGLTIVSCERGDLRQSPNGILIYGDEKKEVPIESQDSGRRAEIQEVYDAIVLGKDICHDGAWGQATMEVCLAILQSATERREIVMKYQVPVRDG